MIQRVTLKHGLASTRLRTPAGFVNMSSTASIEPHEWPRRWTSVSPSAVRSFGHSSTKRSTRHRSDRVGLSDFPLPSWS